MTNRKPRNLGDHFSSVTEFVNYYADKIHQLNKKKDEDNWRKTNEEISKVLIVVHKARITTKQFRTFYNNKYPNDVNTMEK